MDKNKESNILSEKVLKRRSIILGSFSVLLVVLILHFGVDIFLKDSNTVFPFFEVLGQIFDEWSGNPDEHKSSLLANIGITIYRAIGGFLIASFLGISGGILICKSWILSAISRPIIDFLRPLPSSAIIPALVILEPFGTKELSYLTIIVFGSIWPILFNTIGGVGYVDPVAQSSMKQLKMNWYTRLWKFTLPEAFPEIFTGMKVSLSISLILAVTAELLIGGNRGVGTALSISWSSSEYQKMYFYIFVIAFLGFAMNTIFDKAEKKIKWLNQTDEVKTELR